MGCNDYVWVLIERDNVEELATITIERRKERSGSRKQIAKGIKSGKIDLLRHTAGLSWAYNTRPFFQNYHPEFNIGICLSKYETLLLQSMLWLICRLLDPGRLHWWRLLWCLCWGVLLRQSGVQVPAQLKHQPPRHYLLNHLDSTS